MQIMVWMIWIAALAVTAWGSLSPADSAPPPVVSDKWMHFGVYAVLAFIPAIGFRPGRVRIAAILFTIPFGIAMEIGQLSADGRYFEWWDMAANTGGCLAGWLLGRLMTAAIRPRRVPPPRPAAGA